MSQKLGSETRPSYPFRRGLSQQSLTKCQALLLGPGTQREKKDLASRGQVGRTGLPTDSSGGERLARAGATGAWPAWCACVQGGVSEEEEELSRGG